MNWLKFLVGTSALIVAGCAAYFSVTGLGVLFAGASVSVMIMASSLELAKLVSATYLKQNWDVISGFNKWYLTISVAVLMLITSAGIFGYLSNAFQQQNLKLNQIDREISVFDNKIKQNESEITRYTTQLTNQQQIRNSQEANISKIVDKNGSTSRITSMVRNADKEITQISAKINELTLENNKNYEEINKIKNNNIETEKEVGGFRFVAEAFGLELNTVVKFFIFLIVIVFDPLAVALIIAFNGLIGTKRKEPTYDMGDLDDLMYENYKNYQIYGDSEKNSTLEEEIPVIVENNLQKEDFIGKNLVEEEEIPVVVENNRIPMDLDGDGTIDGWDTNNDGIIDEWSPEGHAERASGKRNSLPSYARTGFDWEDKSKWINDQNAVNYWLKYKKQQNEDLVKTY
jgi:hypothetical protein